MNDSVVIKNVPQNANDVVVFVHGFGVRWDSRGMFIDIQVSLPKQWGSVLFDFYEASGSDVFVASIVDQVAKLNEILTTTREQNPKATIHIIAHSMGCIIVALAKLKVSGRIILLSPPESIGTKFRTFFESIPGSKKTGSTLIVPRKDSTITHIPLSYFDESQAIDAQKAVAELSKQQIIFIIQTMKDEILGDTHYDKLKNNENIKIIQIESDHNFTGENRNKLIGLLQELLQ